MTEIRSEIRLTQRHPTQAAKVIAERIAADPSLLRADPMTRAEKDLQQAVRQLIMAIDLLPEPVVTDDTPEASELCKYPITKHGDYLKVFIGSGFNKRQFMAKTEAGLISELCAWIEKRDA